MLHVCCRLKQRLTEVQTVQRFACVADLNRGADHVTCCKFVVDLRPCNELHVCCRLQQHLNGVQTMQRVVLRCVLK